VTLDISPQPDNALQAVLFDMDGLLVDTEGVWFDVEVAAMAELGCQLGPEHAERVVGGPMTRVVRYLIEVCGARVAAPELEGMIIDGMMAALRQGVALQPGAKDLLTQVAAEHVPCALVSSSHRFMMEAVLDSVGRQYFPVTVAGDEVRQMKPSPEPYLTAAARLGVDPAYAVVLEDSPTGVASAEAAGCVTVAVPSVAPIARTNGRLVVPSLEELSLERLRALVLARRRQWQVPPPG
jgi:HAD superfamily hydrolase (TIGR01509 family)